MTERWNHSTHYYPQVLRAVPATAVRALDAGCGDGALARELRPLVDEVIGIDRDMPALGRARLSNTGGPLDVQYVLSDVLAYPFSPGSFDLVATIDALHHMGTAAALDCMQELLRPGGTPVVIGLARNSSPVDYAYDIGGALANCVQRRTACWDHLAPTIWPPADTYTQIRRTVEQVLPGARYRRRLLFRYSLIWTKPAP